MDIITLIILQATSLDTTSMVTLLASLCVVLFGAIGYLYVSKGREIKEVRDEHLVDLRAKNEMNTTQYDMLQKILNGINIIKDRIGNDRPQ